MSFTIDLHTHSTLSHDGGLSIADYARLLSTHALDYIAITDHNEIAFAQKAKQAHGEAIIVGEEIMTTEGEIIGLFLTEKIKPHLSVYETIKEIKRQKGIVYIPHPFETVRSGISQKTLSSIVDSVDIIETFNGRGMFTNKNREVDEFMRAHALVSAASSDAHCFAGIGTCYVEVSKKITKENSIDQLKQATLYTHYAPLYSLLCPKLNKIKKLL